MKPLSRSLALGAGCAAVALLFCCGGLHAQAYPSKPIRVVVPYPAGGYYDLVARTIGQKMSEQYGQPVVVENRSGANGIVGTEHVARSAPDGYTIMVGGIGPHGINPSLYSKLPYDPVRDFAPVILVSVQPTMLVAHPSVPVSSVRELISLARQKPGQVSFASQGSGSTGHLAGVLLGLQAGVELNHVPFKGSAPAVTAVLGGQTDIHFGTAIDVMPHAKAGKLRALAITGAKRLKAMPDLPTLAETVPNYEALAWYAYFAPSGVPREIIAKLNADIGRIMRLPDVDERLGAQGTSDLVGGNPEYLGNFQKSEIAKWAQVVKTSGAKVD